jgi:DNA invertase Pin-like site-specific DNA recombinase
VADDSASEIRAELARLGKRRVKLQADEDKLSDEVRDVLDRAYGTVPVAEAARLLNLHRTTVYRVYEPHEQATA